MQSNRYRRSGIACFSPGCSGFARSAHVRIMRFLVLAGVCLAPCAVIASGNSVLPETGTRIDAARAEALLASSRERVPGLTTEQGGNFEPIRDAFAMLDGPDDPGPYPPYEPRPVLAGRAEEPEGPGVILTGKAGDGLLEYEFGFEQTAFYWHHWQSESQIQAVIDQGYRVHDVEVVSYSPLRFNVIYVKNEGPYERDSLWKYDTTSTVLEHLVNDENYRVTKLKPRQVGTALRFSAILEKNTGDNFKNWRWWWDGSWDGIIDDFVEHNHRPIDMEYYQFDGETRWAGVAIENVGKDHRVWLPVENVSSETFVSLAQYLKDARYTDVGGADGNFYAIMTGGIVQHGLNHWTHDQVPESKVLHLIRRHGARIISIQRTSVVAGDNGLENGYQVTLVDNETPRAGEAKEGFGAIDAAMITSLKLGSIPGGAIAIARDGKLVYARGYGFSNIEANEVATAENMFRLGSISKTMTGMSAMKLIDDGVLTLKGEPLTLDTPVFSDVIFPTLQGENNLTPYLAYPHLADITLRHVLTHTAGWYEQQETYGLDVTPFAGPLPLNNTIGIAKDLGIEYTPDCREIVPYYYGEPLDSPPGDNVFYSGLGICVAALVVEILSNKHYGTYFRDEFITPLGLNQGQKRFGYSSDYLSEKHPTEARYYDHLWAPKVFPMLIEMADYFTDDGTPVFTDEVDAPYGAMPMKSIWSAGSWAASPVAMVRLATALQRTRRPYGPLQYLTFMSFFDSHDANSNGSWGGGGFKTNGYDSIEHGGALSGGFAFYRIHNEHYADSPNLTFALFFNASHTDETYWPSINRVKSAIYDAIDAINSADWDLFPQYGFVEPPPAWNVPPGGNGDEFAVENNGVEIPAEVAGKIMLEQ